MTNPGLKGERGPEGERGREGERSREGERGKASAPGEQGLRGPEGRRGRPGRVIYSRGPIVRIIEITVIISALCAVIALVFSLTLFQNRLDRVTEQQDILNSQQAAIQKSRKIAIQDTCLKLQDVIRQAYSSRPRRLKLPAILPNGTRIMLVIVTPSQKGQAQKQLRADGLVNCALHAQHLTKLPPEQK